MIKFFKYETPVQVVFILVIILCTRVPLLFLGHPILDDEIRNLAIGEKLGDGFLIYKDLLTSLPPLPALVYYLLDIMFGKSREVHAMFALLLVFFQSIFFKKIVDSNELLPAKSFYPALAYMLISGFLYEFTILSETLIGACFLLLALSSTLRIIRTEAEENRLFSIGFYCSLAYLSYKPLGLSIIFFGAMLVIFTRINLKLYLLFFMGCAFPILALLTFFILNNGLYDFYYCFLSKPMVSMGEMMINAKNLSIYLIPLYATVAFCIAVNFSMARLTNYQMVGRQIFLIGSMFFLLLIIYFTNVKTEYFIIVVMFLSYFLCSAMIFLKKKIILEILVWGIFLYPAPFLLGYVHKEWAVFHTQYVEDCVGDIKNKKIFHTGNKLCYYNHNKLGTKYYDWELSKPKLMNVNRYDIVHEINQSFEADMPDIIIDEGNVMQPIFYRIPWLVKKYKMVTPGTYYLIN